MSRTRRLATAVVAASLLLAGCSGLSGSGPATIEETVTPVPVPETTPADDSSDGPRDRTDAAVVAATHYRALEDESYVLTRSVRWRSPNGTDDRERTVVRVDGDGERYVFSHAYADPLGPTNRTGFDVWYDGRRSVVRTTFAEAPPEYDGFERRTYATDAAAPLVRDLFDRLAVERVSVREGGTLVRGSLRRPGSAMAPRGTTSADNGSLSARLHPSGHVDRLAVGYDATVDGDRVRVRAELDVSGVGETTVTEPAWVENATAYSGDGAVRR